MVCEEPAAAQGLLVCLICPELQISLAGSDTYAGIYSQAEDTAQLVECLPSVPEAPGLILRILETMCAGTHMLSHHSGSGCRIIRSSIYPQLLINFKNSLNYLRHKTVSYGDMAKIAVCKPGGQLHCFTLSLLWQDTRGKPHKEGIA